VSPPRLIIAGAGGLGREIAGYARDALAAGRLRAELAGFLDDTDADPAAFGLGLPVLGTIDNFRPQERDRLVVAVGAPADRAAIARRLEGHGARFITILHPLAWVAEPSRIEEGCVIAPFATIGMNARLGRHCLINTHAGIGHDAELGACTVVSPHGVLNGRVRTGERVLIGSAAVVTPGRAIGDDAQVSAGAVVQGDVSGGATVWGNPARPLPQPKA